VYCSYAFLYLPIKVEFTPPHVIHCILGMMGAFVNTMDSQLVGSFIRYLALSRSVSIPDILTPSSSVAILRHSRNTSPFIPVVHPLKTLLS
jgi:hypothetical protein